MPEKKKKSSYVKVKKLKVKLTREFKEGDAVIYTNYGRFVPDEKSKITLVVNDGEQTIKAKAV